MLLEHTQPWGVPGRGSWPLLCLWRHPRGAEERTVRTARLQEQFPPDVVPAGVPNQAKPGEHVRLGDIVVLDQDDAWQGVVYRALPQPPSAHLLWATRSPACRCAPPFLAGVHLVVYEASWPQVSLAQ